MKPKKEKSKKPGENACKIIITPPDGVEKHLFIDLERKNDLVIVSPYMSNTDMNKNTTHSHAGDATMKLNEFNSAIDQLIVLRQKIENKKEFTREDFEREINRIGWTIQKSHNGLNDKLVSPKGTITDLRVEERCVTPFGNNIYGKESCSCLIHFYFNEMIVNHEENFVALGEGRSGIMFMNHDMKKNKK